MFRVTVYHHALSWDVSSNGTYILHGSEQVLWVGCVYVLYSYVWGCVCESIPAAAGI